MIKEIYAFDFDGTIVTNEFPQIGMPINNTIELIKKVKNDGHYIILNTMRDGDLLLDAVKFCQNLGITFDAVNDNLPHMKEFYKNNPRKIFANYYVDDHNLFVYGVNDIQMKKMTNAEKYAGQIAALITNGDSKVCTAMQGHTEPKEMRRCDYRSSCRGCLLERIDCHSLEWVESWLKEVIK